MRLNRSSSPFPSPGEGKNEEQKHAQELEILTTACVSYALRSSARRNQSFAGELGELCRALVLASSQRRRGGRLTTDCPRSPGQGSGERMTETSASSSGWSATADCPGSLRIQGSSASRPPETSGTKRETPESRKGTWPLHRAGWARQGCSWGWPASSSARWES